MALENKCYIDNCSASTQYIIEWYGLNQHGKNPLVVDERAVCSDIEHLVKASYHHLFGGIPDGIVDYETWEKEHPLLVQEVIFAMERSK
ncbi:MAG: hypothetical protein Q8R37_00165 [Nanoarchaeota archaeon]|nr:hypothetical protein [Nanoarchaeota archaeon]